MTEYDATMDLVHNIGMDEPYMCHTPNPGLSATLKYNNYDDFIKIMSAEMQMKGKYINAVFDIKCEGQCPKGCQKKFHIKKLKSITKKTFEKMHKHGIKYPEHCFIVKFDADFKRDEDNGN